MRLSKLVPLFALVATVAGCHMHMDSYGGDDWVSPPDDGTTPPAADVVTATIDADATIQAEPGAGVGVFIEYATGGRWHVFTACDYDTPSNPGQPCTFEIFAKVTAGGAIGGVEPEDLKGPDDGVALLSDGTLQLYTENRTALSGMTFDAPPGASVEFDVYLDGLAEPHYIYWFGDKILHQGAPSDPIILAPNEAAASTDPGTTK